MVIDELKEIIKNSSTAVLVMDEGKPSFVILDYEAYKKIIGVNSVPAEPIKDKNQSFKTVTGPAVMPRTESRESEILERLNKEILAIKNQIEMEEAQKTEPTID